MPIKKLLPNFAQTVHNAVVTITETVEEYGDSAKIEEQRQMDEMLHPGVFSETNLRMAELVEYITTAKDTLSAFMKHGYLLSQTDPLHVEEGQAEMWTELEGYDESWSEYNLWLYQDVVYGLDKRFSQDQQHLIVLDYIGKEQQNFERLRAKFSIEQLENVQYERSRIPEDVRIEVWRRDQGKCAGCGSREKLEYDHIVPVSRGGSNTARNVELLCEACNRNKGDRIQ